VIFEADHLGAATQVTVTVPLYNYAGLIGEALNSVAAQTLRELDLIVIDDALRMIRSQSLSTGPGGTPLASIGFLYSVTALIRASA
jgi:hypothetical protein